MTITGIILSGLANYRTTIAGVALGGGTYLGTLGITLPSTRQEWGVFASSGLIAILGLLAKDSTTGSQPANPVAPPPEPAKVAPPA